MHLEAYAYVSRTLERYGPFEDVAEFGGAIYNGEVRSLFGTARYTSVDLRPGSGVDVVADAAYWAPGKEFDCIVCCEVFEHCEYWMLLLTNSMRLLRHNGVLIITMATDPREPHSGTGEGLPEKSEWYQNVKPSDLLIALTQRFPYFEIHVNKQRGDLQAMACKGFMDEKRPAG